jgi:hypothetical protein
VNEKYPIPPTPTPYPQFTPPLIPTAYLLLSLHDNLIRILRRGRLQLVRRSLLPPLLPRRIIRLHLLKAIIVAIVIELVQRLEHNITAHDILVEKPRQCLGNLVVHVCACWDGENVIQLLECALLRLGDPEEDHDEGDDVETGVEAECALGG